MAMKQIFDWLREQTYRRCEVKLGSIKQMNLSTVHEVIDEAEAKWEADCCEWKYTGHLNEYAEAHELSVGALKIIGWKFCPICGKPIKISEVE